MLSRVGHVAVIVVFKEEVEPYRHLKSLQDSYPSVWKTLCFWGSLWEREFPPCQSNQQAASYVQWEQPLCSSWILCVMDCLGTLYPSCVPNCVNQTTSRPECYAAFCVWRKVWWFFWERNYNFCVIGKRQVNCVFFGTLDSTITPAGCFVPQLTVTLKSTAKWVTLSQLFLVKR